MATLPDRTPLAADDVIGRRIVEIWQSSEINDANGMDWVSTHYRLDSGAVFFLPFEDEGRLYVEQPPVEANITEHSRLDSVLGQRIVRVLRDGPNAEITHDSPYLLLENGWLLTDVRGYPHGVGYAGIHVYSPGEIDVSQMVDFFAQGRRAATSASESLPQ